MSKFENIVEAINEIAPYLRELAPQMDQSRRLSENSAASLGRRTDMFRLLTPGSIGGPELKPFEFFRVLEMIAAANASAAWCAMISSTNGISAAYLEPDIARDIFGDPNIITGGVFAPRGKAIDMGDHYLVSGRWAWGSGSANCAWLAGGCTVWNDGEMLMRDASGPEVRMMIFPSREAELIDTWHVMGMRGTGSGDFEVSKVRVPKTRSVSLMCDRPKETGALYKFPVFGLLALGIAAVAVGNGRAAIDKLMIHALNKKLPHGKSPSDKSFMQTAIAELEADWQACRAFIVQEVKRLWDIAEGKNDIPVNDRASLRLACTKATRTNADICRRIYELGGGDALFEDQGFERRFRDAFGMTQHIMTGAGTYEMVGRVMLEKPINITMI